MRTANFTIVGVSLLFGCLATTPPTGTTRAVHEEAAEPERAAGAHSGAVEPALAERVIVVTLDGVRWQEVFGGVDADLARSAGLPRGALVGAPLLVPNLYAWFFRGGTVLGSPAEGGGFSPSGPHYVSLPAYLELASGGPTPCFSNDCGVEPAWTFFEEVAERLGKGREDVAIIASWEKIASAGWSRPSSKMTLDAGRADGDRMPAWPGSGGYRPDHYTHARAMDHLAKHAPKLLWVALGDTDEWAHRHDYRGYLASLRSADAALGELMTHLAESGALATTMVLVTTDHGRDSNFADHGGKASAATWLAARGGPVAAHGMVPVSRPRHLGDVAPTVLHVLGLPPQACLDCGEPLSELL